VRYLLDTCTFLWLAQQPAALSDAAVTAIDDLANELWVSDVSIWEIAMKHSAGRLPLPGSPRKWIPAKLAYHQLLGLSLNHEAIYRSGELPRCHADPFDRLLAAQAIEEGFTVLSPDLSLSALGARRAW
jgi:PIN domain nuclease of toxin-antitoxin system